MEAASWKGPVIRRARTGGYPAAFVKHETACIRSVIGERIDSFFSLQRSKDALAPRCLGTSHHRL